MSSSVRAARRSPSTATAPYTGSGVEKSRDGRKTQSRYAPPKAPDARKQRAFMIAAHAGGR